MKTLRTMASPLSALARLRVMPHVGHEHMKYLLLTLVSILMSGPCLGQELTDDGRQLSGTSTNFLLLVGNHSFAITPVDIAVFIDGKKVLEGDFDITGHSIPAHNYYSFGFYLAEGKHILRAVSKKGTADNQIEFEQRGMRWGGVLYCYQPNKSKMHEELLGPAKKLFSLTVIDFPPLIE